MTMSIGASISSSSRQHLGGVAEHADRQRPALVAGRDRQLDGVLERGRLDVEVAVLDPALDPRLVALDADHDAVVHGDRERLGAAHAAEPGGQGDRAGQRAVEPLVGHGGERLERALQDALGADVDPRAGGHLAVHRQPEVLEPAELLPVGPVADQVGVGDQHPRRPLVGAHHADRLAATARASSRRPRGRAACAPGRRTPPSCARPCRCRRRRRGPRGARRSRGRGCSSASAAAPRSATTSRSARCRVAAWMGSRGLVVGHASSPITVFDGGRTAPDRTSSTAVSISGDRWRSGPGPSMPDARSRRTTARGGRRRLERRPQVERPGGGEHLDRDHPGQAVDRAAQLAGGRPAHRDVVLLHRAATGSSRPRPGTASRLSSETIAAWVYCAIMWPLSTPGSSARNGGSPWLRALSRNRSVRRSLIEATSAATIARKSST